MDNDEGEWKIGRRLLKQLRRESADLKNRTRWILWSDGLPAFYDVSSGTWAMSDPRGGTLFKRRSQAVAVLRAYGSKYPPKLARVKVDKRGRLVIGSLPVSDSQKRHYRKWIREWDAEHVTKP